MRTKAHGSRYNEVLFGLALLAVLSCPHIALAEIYTWSGATDTSWTTPGNWTPGGYPSNESDTAVFSNAVPRQSTINSSVTVGVVQVAGSTNWTWSGTATVTVDSAFNYGSAGTGTFNAVIGGTGQVVTTAGSLILAGVNAYSGTTWVKGGTLQGDMDPNKKSFGNTTSAILVGDITGSADATLYIKGGNINFARDITVQTGSTGRATLQFEGSGSSRDVKVVTMNKSTYFKVSSGSGYHAMDGKITGAGDLIKTGPTILDITCLTNDYTGKTIILEGYLQADTSITNLGTPSAGNEEIIIGDTSGSASAGLITGNSTITINRNIRIRAGSSGESFFLNGGGSGRFTVNGDIIMEKDLTWRQNLQSDTINGRILTGGAGGDLIKYNTYTLTYANTNAPQNNNTRINAGVVCWNRSAPAPDPVAFGSGTIILSGGSFTFDATINQNWVVTNGFSGNGTVNVETGTNTLTVMGRTVAPGSTGAVDTIIINGSLAFQNDGGSNGVLLIRLRKPAGSVTNSMIAVSRNLGGLLNAKLSIDVEESISAPDVQGQEYTVAICTNDLTGQEFASVVGSETTNPSGRWRATVECGAGVIKLKNMYVATSGTIITVR